MSSSSSPSNGNQEPNDKVIDPDFTGKWRLKEYIGIDEYLKSEGWSWIMRKTISKLSCYNYIYHHHKSIKDKEIEHITIKNVNKTGVYELIHCVNLNDKKEIKYKDKSGDKIISVFKWNRDKSQIIEFLLKEIPSSQSHNGFGISTSSHNQSYSHKHSRKKRKKKKQKSYTKCRYIDATNGRMIESITNQNGKTCTSVYVREDDISIKHLKHILHIKDDEDDTKRSNECDIHFPINILELMQQNEERQMDDDEKLTLENIAIQKEIQRLSEQIVEFQRLLELKQEELQQNIARNDEVINVKNTIKKWKEFEAEWYKWDTLYFIGWLRRIEWKNKQFADYEITKANVDKYAMCHVGDGPYFKGKYLSKFDCDALRQIGINDEEDSFCVYQQILELIETYPMKKYQSPLVYVKKSDDEKGNKTEGHGDLEVFLKDIGLDEYYEGFQKNGFDDLKTILDCIKHKGMDYVEQNILSKKLKINKMNHRIRLLDALKQRMDKY